MRQEFQSDCLVSLCSKKVIGQPLCSKAHLPEPKCMLVVACSAALHLQGPERERENCIFLPINDLCASCCSPGLGVVDFMLLEHPQLLHSCGALNT